MRPYDVLMTEKFGDRYLEYRNLYNATEMSGRLPFPLEIDIDLRDLCNISCVSCHSIGRKRSNALMDRRTLDKIVEECALHRLAAVNLGGCSEPLIDKEYVSTAAEEFKKAGVMDIFLHTNALLLDAKASEMVINAGVTHFCVSIDAVSEETYFKMRGGQLSRLLDNVKTFLKIRGSSPLPALRVSFLANSVNIHEKEGFLEYWSNLADYVDIQNYYTSYDTQPSPVYEPISEATVTRHPIDKRIAIVAPDYLCSSCAGVAVTHAINSGNTLEKYGSIKNFWDNK